MGNVVNFRFRAITGGDYASDIAIDDISVTGTVGTPELDGLANFTIFPNPANDKLNIAGISTLETTTINVYNSVGELVLQKANVMRE